MSFLGCAAIAVPMGFSDGGLPAGLMISARHFDEATLFEVSKVYLQATCILFLGWHILHNPFITNFLLPGILQGKFGMRQGAMPFSCASLPAISENCTCRWLTRMSSSRTIECPRRCSLSAPTARPLCRLLLKLFAARATPHRRAGPQRRSLTRPYVSC